MAIQVKIKVEQLSRLVYEIRAVVKGKFYSRRYMGYSKKDAIKLFERWLNTQL